MFPYVLSAFLHIYGYERKRVIGHGEESKRTEEYTEGRQQRRFDHGSRLGESEAGVVL